jgi:hypothetical protein
MTPDDQGDQSQEQATQDSGLTTPQPDQPAPTEAERAVQEAEGQQDESAREPVDQVAQAAQRESELEEARRVHNERTGGGEIQEGELAAQRDEHNRRSGGGLPQDQDQA